MGILDRFFPTKTQTTGSGQYIPASESGTALSRTGNAMMESGTAMLNRAGEIYRANPRKFQALGVLAGAVLLARMKRGR